MNLGADESAMPGECPLCQAAVPHPSEPRVPGDVLSALARHFTDACAAIPLPLPGPARPG